MRDRRYQCGIEMHDEKARERVEGRGRNEKERETMAERTKRYAESGARISLPLSPSSLLSYSASSGSGRAPSLSRRLSSIILR